MHTGERSPVRLLEDEQYTQLSTQLISSNSIQTQT